MRKAILLPFILFIFSVQVYAQGNQEKAKAYYFSAVEQYESGNYSKAIEYCGQIEDLLGSTNARVEAVRLKSYFDKGDTKKAKESLDNFLSMKADESLLKEVSPYIVKIEEAVKEDTKWESAQNANEESAFKDYLNTYPNGKYATQAKTALKQIEREEYERTHTTCDVCNGKGSINKNVTCPKCDEGQVDGKRTCSKCKGTGKNTEAVGLMFSKKEDVCKSCHGLGYFREKVTCMACHGEGTITKTETCSKCDGEGVVLKMENE